MEAFPLPGLSCVFSSVELFTILTTVTQGSCCHQSILEEEAGVQWFKMAWQLGQDPGLAESPVCSHGGAVCSHLEISGRSGRFIDTDLHCWLARVRLIQRSLVGLLLVGIPEREFALFWRYLWDNVVIKSEVEAMGTWRGTTTVPTTAGADLSAMTQSSEPSKSKQSLTRRSKRAM